MPKERKLHTIVQEVDAQVVTSGVPVVGVARVSVKRAAMVAVVLTGVSVTHSAAGPVTSEGVVSSYDVTGTIEVRRVVDGSRLVSLQTIAYDKLSPGYYASPTPADIGPVVLFEGELGADEVVEVQMNHDSKDATGRDIGMGFDGNGVELAHAIYGSSYFIHASADADCAAGLSIAGVTAIKRIKSYYSGG